jgi:hypothetical protein
MKKQLCTPVAALLAAVTLFLITAASASAGPGYALSFDGVDDYVTVPDHPALTFTNAFTWEAWIKITKTVLKFKIAKAAKDAILTTG